jgi:hypothetical protein
VTGRGARLVLATAGLSLGAAALAAAAPSLPEGLAAACAPDLVLRELLAGLAVLVLLVAPSFAADDPARGPEDHGGLLAALAAVPAAVALAAAGGLAPASLLPAGALLLACDAAASAFLRLDPAGRRGPLFAGAAAALLAGIPVAAYGLAELGGWEGAAAGFRVSPLLAARDVAGGWGAVGPAALLLVAVAAVLRFAGLRRRVPAAAAAAALLLLPGAPGARGAEETPGDATVLVVGAPREGDYASLVGALRAKGLPVREVDAFPGSLPWRTEVLVFARPPRSPAEAESWTGAAESFCAMGGGAVLWPGAPVGSGDPRRALGVRLLFAGVDAADLLLRSPVAVRHPAEGSEPGVNPALFRVPFPVPPRSLPGRTLGFLAVLAASFGGTALLARRRGYGQARAAGALGGISLAGAALLFLPGILEEPVRTDRLVVEERAREGTWARRVEILRIERLRPGGADPVLRGGTGGAWTEVRFAPESPPALQADGAVRLEAPGRYALVARVSGEASAPPGEAPLAQVEAGGEWGPLLAGWRRSPESRVARAGRLLAACFRPPPEAGPLRISVPPSGPDVVVTHLR